MSVSLVPVGSIPTKLQKLPPTPQNNKASVSSSIINNNIDLTPSSSSSSTAIIQTIEDEKISSSDIVLIQGRWHLLPMEISDKIWLYIGDVDMCGAINSLSKHKTFRPTEAVYRYFCERIYLAQTSKGQLRIENWRSWRRMLINRPRLRVNGFYCLKTLYTRAPCNDNFWEAKKTQSIEMTYYRYMRFYNDGRMLYAMNTIHPHDMARQLKSGQPDEKKIYLGTYTLTGRRLEVSVQLHYCVMFFSLSVQDADDGWIGKHNMLSLESHSCSAIQSDTPGSYDQRVMFNNNHEICNYLFWRQWYWNG